MRVKCHSLARLLGLLADVNEGIGPLIVGVEKPVGADGESLGGEAELLDVGHVYQSLSDLDEMLWPNKERVSPRDDNVLNLGRARNMTETRVPLRPALFEKTLFLEKLRIGTDIVRSRAVCAIRRAYICS